jgi:excisionase family DNA binding protein
VIALRTKQLLATTAAAARLGVSSRWLLQLVEAGKLPAVKVWHGQRDQYIFTAESVEALAQTRTRKAAGAK